MSANYVEPQYLLGQNGSALDNNLTPPSSADWSQSFGGGSGYVGPSAGADTWAAYHDYSPGGSPTLTSASPGGLTVTLSSPRIVSGTNYAALAVAIPSAFLLGRWTLAYQHDFPAGAGAAAGRYTTNAVPSFVVASDWSVQTTAPNGNVVQNSDGSIPVPLLFTLLSSGATVGGPSNNAYMRFGANAPNTDAAASSTLAFINPSGSTGVGPTSAITRNFHGSVVTAATTMTVTCDNVVPASSGFWSSILLYNQTHTVTVTVYPPGTVLGGGGGGTPTAPAAALSAVLNIDAHRRPLAVLSGGTATAPTLRVAYSDDAGHSFPTSSLGTGSDPSLLVDTRRNVYRVPFYSGSALSQHTGSLQDGYVAAPGSPAAIAGLTGKYPCAAQHPTDRDCVLLAYLDGTALKTALSADAGATWTFLAIVATGVNFAASGRPALCWLGETAFLASGPGPGLLVRKSLDRGATWSAPITVATAATNPNYTSAAYSGLSLLGWQGRLYLLGWTYGAAGTTLSPTLWICPDLGVTWTPSPGTLPAGLAPPSALGMLPTVARHRLGITHSSADDTAHWLPD